VSQTSSRKQKPKILVVDDEPDNLDLLYRTFRRDYRVFRSEEGHEALKILEQEQDIAVIISDQRMPNMSGTELLSITATNYPDTMRIILTGYTDVEDLVDAINSGKVFKYVTKPWDAENLKAIVEQALDTYNLVKRRTEELNKSLRRESLLNSVTNTIRNHQYGDPDKSPLQDVLQTIVNTVGQVLELDICILRPFEDNHLGDQWFIYRKSDLALEETDQTHLELTVWETQEIEVINDVSSYQSFQEDRPEIQQRLQAYQQAGIHSTLIVPLISQFDVMAVLALHFCGEPHIWEEDEIKLTNIVADQAALAISQARAYEKVRSLAKRETLINTITSAIRSTLDPQAIFTAITKQLGQALQVNGCALSLWTKKNQFVKCVGLYDVSEIGVEPEDFTNKELPQSIVPISENPVLQELLKTSKPVVLEDMEEHSEMNRFDLPLRSPARALLIVPLIVDGEIIGSISLRQTHSSRQWSQSDIELAQAVASQAAIAVQQARLYEKTKLQAKRLAEGERRVRELNKYLTESVLKRFLPQTMVEKAATGQLVLDLTPEPRLVTILFSDIVGFTPLSNKLGPRAIAELLNEYLETMTKAVFENGGTVDKFIGDAVLALFGAPEELPPNEQAIRAIAVAKAMYRHLGELNEKWQAKGLMGNNGAPIIQFRCGIHQGNVVVGMFGGGQRSDYTAIGPAVNMAARLQEAADPKNILVSETVAQYLNPSDIVESKTRQLKGIEGEVLTFSVKVDQINNEI
jgi:class 3 adenylate cyclase/DNA-binding response OmpR family regulator